MVSKPSPETPVDAYLVAECLEAAGLPPGVFNVLPAGRETGDYLVRHPDIDKISFTGSTAAGKAIQAAAASASRARASSWAASRPRSCWKTRISSTRSRA